jgi:hypothetical protein
VVPEADHPLDVVDKVEPPSLVEEGSDDGLGSDGPWWLEDPHYSQVVQDGDLPGIGEFHDGVDVEIELRRLVVLGEHGVPENGYRAKRGIGEHDIAAQVVPGASAAERDDPADTGRLRIHGSA